MEQERIWDCKQKYNQFTEDMMQIADLIVNAEVDAEHFNSKFQSFQELVHSIGQAQNLDMNALTPAIYGQIPNSQLLVIGYIDKLIYLVDKMKTKQELYKQSTEIITNSSSAAKFEYNSNDFFLEMIDHLSKSHEEGWFKSVKLYLDMITLQKGVRD